MYLLLCCYPTLRSAGLLFFVIRKRFSFPLAFFSAANSAGATGAARSACFDMSANSDKLRSLGVDSGVGFFVFSGVGPGVGLGGFFGVGFGVGSVDTGCGAKSGGAKAGVCGLEGVFT